MVSFSNLARAAILIVPCPAADPSDYPHLATFVLGAPKTQQQQLRTTVGRIMTQRIGTSPIWRSTAGARVFWLHVKLDDEPKYYGFAP